MLTINITSQAIYPNVNSFISPFEINGKEEKEKNPYKDEQQSDDESESHNVWIKWIHVYFRSEEQTETSIKQTALVNLLLATVAML